MSIEPDTKDWTWVLDRPCPECGYVAGDVTADRLGDLVRDNATAWGGALRGPQVRERPRPGVWSTLEYACHVRDVHRVFAGRVRLMLDAPEGEVARFANWDQDAAAVEGSYGQQDPDRVGEELLDAAAEVAALYDAVPPQAWSRRAVRSNGSEFSVESLGRYHLHDLVHHLWDVDADAGNPSPPRDRADATGGSEEISESVRSVLDRFLEALGPGAHVLELQDQVPLDLSERGGAPYDAVRAGAGLLPRDRAGLPVVLERLGALTRPGGTLYASVEQGDTDAWREAPLREALAAAGWDVIEVGHSAGRAIGSPGEVWLDVLARRRPAEPRR